MPELPEIEVIKNYLKGLLIGKKITKIKILNSNLRYKVPEAVNRIQGARITSLHRQSKYLQVFLDNTLVLVIHLGISGRILIKELDYKPIKHDHAIFYFDDFTLVYNDARRFGLIDIISQQEIKNHKLFAHLGIEPLNLDIFSLSQMLKKSQKPIKHFLMDNKHIVGIGNIYANEILFYSKINPYTKSHNLSDEQINVLFKQIIQILNKSIKLGGSSIRDFMDPGGVKGRFAETFMVYSRPNLPCKLCNTPIKWAKVQGRSTFLCPSCQKN